MEKDFASQPEDCVPVMGMIPKNVKGPTALHALYETHSDYSMKKSLKRERNQNDVIGTESEYF